MVPLVKPQKAQRRHRLSWQVVGQPQTPEHLHIPRKGLEAALTQARQQQGSGMRELCSSEGRRKEAKERLGHVWSSHVFPLAASVLVSGKTKVPILPSRVRKKKEEKKSFLGLFNTQFPAYSALPYSLNCLGKLSCCHSLAGGNCQKPNCQLCPLCPRGPGGSSRWADHDRALGSPALPESSPSIPGPGQEQQQPGRGAGPAAERAGGTVPQPPAEPAQLPGPAGTAALPRDSPCAGRGSCAEQPQPGQGPLLPRRALPTATAHGTLAPAAPSPSHRLGGAARQRRRAAAAPCGAAGSGWAGGCAPPAPPPAAACWPWSGA